MSSLAGKWKAAKQENVEGFLKALGVPPQFCSMAVAMSENEVIEIAVDGNRWSYKSSDGTDQKFELEKEFLLPVPDGSSMKVVAHLEGDKLISVQTNTASGIVINVERFLENGRLVVLMKHMFQVRRHEYVRS